MPAIFIFIGLLAAKLIGYLQVSWVWVTCPLWAAPALVFLIVFGTFAWMMMVILSGQTVSWLLAGLFDVTDVKADALADALTKHKKK